MSAKEQFQQASYRKLKGALQAIPTDERGDIYALSFWFSFDNDDLRYPGFSVSYNTRANYRAEAKTAATREEAKWNYACWLQEEIAAIGGQADPLREAWYGESMRAGSRNFDGEFIEEMIALAQRLFSEGVVSATFGKDLPILVHELEYYDEPIGWTIRANPPGLADEFLAAYKGGAL